VPSGALQRWTAEAEGGARFRPRISRPRATFALFGELQPMDDPSSVPRRRSAPAASRRAIEVVAEVLEGSAPSTLMAWGSSASPRRASNFCAKTARSLGRSASSCPATPATTTPSRARPPQRNFGVQVPRGAPALDVEMPAPLLTSTTRGDYDVHIEKHFATANPEGSASSSSERMIAAHGAAPRAAARRRRDGASPAPSEGTT
jgi:hypothetical protein